MAYTLSWHTPDKVLLLSISGDYSLEEAKEVNDIMTNTLDQSDYPLLLLIDAESMKRPYHFQQLRTTQTYMDHKKLKYIFVITNDKLVRLAMMVVFNLGRAYLQLFDSINHAQPALEKFTTTASH